MVHKFIFYKTAAELLKLAKETGANIKHILYNEHKYQYMNIKSLFALVTEALKHWDILDKLIYDTKILSEEQVLNIWHIRVLITELYFGKKVIDVENKCVQKIFEYEDKFNEILSSSKVKEMLKQYKQKPNASIKESFTMEGHTALMLHDLFDQVRYIKVNTIKVDLDFVIQTFIEEGWEQLRTADNYQGYIDQLKQFSRDDQHFLQDFHIPDVLVFPPNTELHNHKFYKNGSFLFMDKSSCLAAHLLQPQPGCSVLDMCAAPGLKTIHLAALARHGKVYAVERDVKRFRILTEMVGNSDADNVELINQDVSKLQLDLFRHVEYILLDPSCSGSGMRDRQPLIGAAEDKDRLHRLGGFQLTLLRFALTRFPAAKRVVYSTCSVNEEENEEVIQAALNSKYHNFHVVSVSSKLPGWQSFGSTNYEFGLNCIYSRPDKDLTNGFFVTVFERKKGHNNYESEREKNKNSKTVKASENNFKSALSLISETKPRKRLHSENNPGDDQICSAMKKQKMTTILCERNSIKKLYSENGQNKLSNNITSNLKATKITKSLKKRLRQRKKKVEQKPTKLAKEKKPVRPHTKVDKIMNSTNSNDINEKPKFSTQKNCQTNFKSKLKISNSKLRRQRKKKLREIIQHDKSSK